MTFNCFTSIVEGKRKEIYQRFPHVWVFYTMMTRQKKSQTCFPADDNRIFVYRNCGKKNNWVYISWRSLLISKKVALWKNLCAQRYRHEEIGRNNASNKEKIIFENKRSSNEVLQLFEAKLEPTMLSFNSLH